MSFLLEPYNAYQKPPKKKHWMEIAEEEALFHRMQLEEASRQKDLFQEALKQHLALREANAKQNPSNLNNQNVALPQYAPQPASQQVQDGQYAAPAGGGGWANPVEEEETEVVSFTAAPTSGAGPLQVFFTNTTPTPGNDTFYWTFGSGSLTSTLANPGSRKYTQTGSYTVTLQGTSSVGVKSTTSKIITVSDPVLNAWVSLADLSTPAPYSASITGTHTYNGNGTVSGFWNYGDGTAAVAYVSGAGVLHIYTTGSWTASLALTESSYGHTSVATIYISASLPWLSPKFTVITESRVAPATASFTNTSTQYVNDLFVYRWVFGDGTTDSVFAPTHVYSASQYAVRLEMSESYYGVKAVYVLPGGITESAPILTPLFTADVVTGTAPLPVTFSNASTQVVNVNDSFAYKWVFGDGATSTFTNPQHQYAIGTWPVRLTMTESFYNITANYTLPAGITGSA